MRLSTLCLRSVHLPLRWLHPAEGSFLGNKENGPVGWVENFRMGGALGIRVAGGEDFEFHRLPVWFWKLAGWKPAGRTGWKPAPRVEAFDWVGF